MESVSLEMDDIFEDRLHGGGDENGYDDEELPPHLPDLPERSAGEEQAGQNDDEAENQEVLARLKGMKGASKITVKQPQPKLDSTRLTGERGIPVLPHIFQDVKLKGKGHEAEDLHIVMRYLEHWAHRLFPKMPFDEVLARIERLGTKREVQTCIKKMRLDMPVLAKDMMNGDQDKNDDELQQQGTQTQQQQQDKTTADLFDELLREEEALRGENSQTNGHGAENGGISQAGTSSASTSSMASATTSTGLSDDLLERIDRNKRLAMERRAHRMGGATSSQPSSSQSAFVPQTAPYASV